ncbi:MAG: hypothetical protein HYV63_07865 [Candidatus Schekmanbacteria bacterium]|nr:hypothetical protein [Candidatus Schekmanbacteria bacterium]
MDATVVMIVLWVLFATSHVGIAASRMRTALIGRFGKLPYLYAYIGLAQVLFAILPIYYATHRFAGPRGPALGELAWVHPILIASIVCGLLLIVGSFSPKQYVSSMPFAALVRQPYGLERITRHPFFVGTALWAGAHALLSTRLIGTVFFSGFVCLGLLGTIHQERKLIREKGPEYERYLRSTSLLPLAAVLAGRQSMEWREQPWMFLMLGGVCTWLLRTRHEHLLGWNGAGFALFFFVATSYLTLEVLRREQQA